MLKLGRVCKSGAKVNSSGGQGRAEKKGKVAFQLLPIYETTTTPYPHPCTDGVKFGVENQPITTGLFEEIYLL